MLLTTIALLLAAASAGGVVDVLHGLPGSEPEDGAIALHHRLRGADTMADLVSQLAPAERPRRIVYVASGAHLAPLAACELLPPDESCQLTLTEIDAAVQDDVETTLRALEARGAITILESGSRFRGTRGQRSWKLQAGGTATQLELRVAPPSDELITAALVETADLIVTHDLSGDPHGLLRLIRQHLHAARRAGGPAPLLMIEDLERHPYPVAVDLFTPVARAGAAYGHRTSDAGLGRHGEAESGPALFSGGVLLSFADGWWRDVDPQTLDGVLDLLLLWRFDDDRRNVLEGGSRPLLAPMLLDWWTGFGERVLDGPLDPAARRRAVAATVAALPLFRPAVANAMACRLQAYRVLLHLRAAGGTPDETPPGARLLSAAQLPTEEMRRLYREALRNVGGFKNHLDEQRSTAEELLTTIDSIPVREAAAACPVPVPTPEVAVVESWREARSALLSWLEHR